MKKSLCPLLSVLGLVSILNLSGCRLSSDQMKLDRTSSALIFSKSNGADTGSDPATRFIKVFDSNYLGFSFDVLVDGKRLGSTPANEDAQWATALSPGSHLLELVAGRRAASDHSKVWVSLYSGMMHPVSFPEPQGVSSLCKFLYSQTDLAPLTGLGKQQAECSIAAGERLSLLVVVPADSPTTLESKATQNP